MMALNISDNGTIEQTEMELEDIRDNIEAAVATELETVWEKIKDQAIELCPKQSGALASSIELESEGGSGTVGASGGGDFYSNSIYAGNDQTFNSYGQPTSQYALLVHDGHADRNGVFHEGTPFLTEAMMTYEDEIESCIDRAMSENGWNTQQ